MLSIRRFLLHRICVQHLIKPDFFVFEKGNFLYKPSLFQSSDTRGKSPNLAIAILQHASILSLGYVSDWNHLPKKEKRWLLLSKALLAYTNGFQQACSFKVLRQDVAGLCAETCSLSCYLEEGECGASYQKLSLVIPSTLLLIFFCKYAKIIPYLPGLFVMVI